MIKERRGDLFGAAVDALVNPINTQGVMGKGLALQFKKRFPAMFKQYRRACQAGEVRLGRVHLVERDESPRFIFGFPTKGHWRERSKLVDIRAGLDDLVGQVQKTDVRSIAIPALGCGLGGLAWCDVRAEIVDAFDALPRVEVLLFAPR